MVRATKSTIIQRLRPLADAAPSSLLLALVVSLGLSACVRPSVDDLCTDVAESRCTVCFDCAEDADPDGAALCSLPEGTSQEECVEVVRERCENRAGTLERPKADIQQCRDVVDSTTCEALYGAFAQDRRVGPAECSYFVP